MREEVILLVVLIELHHRQEAVQCYLKPKLLLCLAHRRVLQGFSGFDATPWKQIVGLPVAYTLDQDDHIVIENNDSTACQSDLRSSFALYSNCEQYIGASRYGAAPCEV